MSREVVVKLRRDPRGFCSLCCRAAPAVVLCAAPTAATFYGFCPRCVARMTRIAKFARTTTTKGR